MQKCHTFQDYTQHTILLMVWYGPPVFMNFYIFHPHFHLPILHLLFQTTTVQSIAFRKNFTHKFRNMSCYVTSNCIRIDSQNSPHPVPMSFWLLQAPIINQAHLKHFAPCWLATLIFQVFCVPLSGNDIGLHTMWRLVTPWFMILDSGKK